MQPSLLNNRGQDDVRVALHAGAALGISAHQIETSALVGLRPHHHAEQSKSYHISAILPRGCFTKFATDIWLFFDPF